MTRDRCWELLGEVLRDLPAAPLEEVCAEVRRRLRSPAETTAWITERIAAASAIPIDILLRDSPRGYGGGAR